MKKSLLIIILGFIFLSSAYGETTVLVEIPDYDVRVNDEVIDTKHSQYPVLKYKNITYFPMTWDYLSGLGLNLKYSSLEGLQIDRKATIGRFHQDFLGASNTIGSKHYAKIADYKVYVNHNRINNESETYPVLMYKDITYFPMTWRFAVEEFGWKTKWDSKSGFQIITGQSESKILPPETYESLSEKIATYKNLSYHSFKVDLDDFDVKTALAQDTIGKTDSLNNIASENQAILAINGSYFDAYLKDDSPKDPYGILVVDGEVVHTGDNRATIGFSNGSVDIDRVGKTIYGWNGYPKNTYAWYGYFLNHTVYENWPSAIIYTPARGEETLAKVGTNYIVENNKIIDIVKNKSVKIPKNGYVVNLHGVLGNTPEQVYERFQIGYSSDFEITFKSDNPVWDQVEYATSAGPALILDGQIDIDLDYEQFTEAKIRTQSAARSAIGYTKDNELILVTTTATIDELADLMLYLGCYEAMNLDGGASSGLWYNGSYKREPGRLISNIIYVTKKH